MPANKIELSAKAGKFAITKMLVLDEFAKWCVENGEENDTLDTIPSCDAQLVCSNEKVVRKMFSTVNFEAYKASRKIVMHNVELSELLGVNSKEFEKFTTQSGRIETVGE